MMGFGLIGTVLVIAVVAYFLGWRPQANKNLFDTSSKEQSPREILDERYARGEISKDEFEQMKDDIGK